MISSRVNPAVSPRSSRISSDTPRSHRGLPPTGSGPLGLVHSSHAARRRRILIVEDDAEVRELAEIILSREGYMCHSAGNAIDVLAMTDRALRDVDLLLTDVLIPGTDGPTLAQLLRRRCPSLKVLLISAWVRPGDRRISDDELVPGRPNLRDTARAAGWVRLPLLTKPFGYGDLVERVRVAIG